MRFRTRLSSLLTGVALAAGCGSLFPSGGGGGPPGGPSMPVHGVRVDTVGYLPERAKIATVVLPAGQSTLSDPTAQVVDSAGNVIWTCVMTGPMTDQAMNNAVYYLADFTAFNEPGTYTLQVPALGSDINAQSAPFTIAPDAMLEPLRTAMTGMYGQRCGTAVRITLGSDTWSHAACHLHDASSLKYLTGVDQPYQSVGGWHDAGDYGKYTNNGAFTVGMLLAAWERFAPSLSGLALPIPEHGQTAAGGTGPMPDFLWEVKWELDWLLTAQQASGTGAVPDKLTAINFESYGTPPEFDGQARYFSGAGTAMAADVVAVMAAAARIYQTYAPDAAAKYLAAAQQSYAYLQTTTDPPYALNDSLMNDARVFKTGPYNEGDADNRLWAAAELWETTGDPAVRADFEKRAMNAVFTSDFDWPNMQNMGLYTYVLSQRTDRDPTLLASLTASLTSTADALVTTAQSNIFGRAIGDSYYWGSNGSVARAAMTLAAANVVSPDPKYLDAIQLQVDFLLGRNYYDRSQVTMLGYNPPVRPHHGPSSADSVVDPWPGLVVGGANSMATGATGTKIAGSPFDWVDDPVQYEVNEIAINWNAPFIFATAALTPAGAN